jgi:hypothetical protein
MRRQAVHFDGNLRPLGNGDVLLAAMYNSRVKNRILLIFAVSFLVRCEGCRLKRIWFPM